ncbi:hypothetical protein ACFE04_002711 [Oxalis oulophora]
MDDTMTWDILQMPCRTPTATPSSHVPKWEYDYSTKYLVELSGVLLMLCKIIRGEDNLDEDYDEVNDVKSGFTEHFEVLKLVKKKKTRKNKNGIRKTRNKYDYNVSDIQGRIKQHKLSSPARRKLLGSHCECVEKQALELSSSTTTTV